jgi:hypothetical protein
MGFTIIITLREFVQAAKQAKARRSELTEPISQFYFGWGVNYRTPWRYETLVGFEYFFSDSADFGYVLEFGMSRLKLESEGSEDGNRLGKRLLFGYHFYF